MCVLDVGTEVLACFGLEVLLREFFSPPSRANALALREGKALSPRRGLRGEQKKYEMVTFFLGCVYKKDD